jgi:hypothetical protein
MGEKINSCRLLVGNSKGKRRLGRPKLRWVDKIKIDLWKDRMVWSGLAWLR